ncbi:MAG: alpha-galactosidase, partial [Actinomycetota bacterium]
MSELVRLVSPDAESEVIVDVSTGAPTIRYWGGVLGGLAGLTELERALDRPLVHGTFDSVAPISMVPEHGSGFMGRPGLAGRRGGGRDWSPRFTTVSHDADGATLKVEAVDEQAGLALTCRLALNDVLRASVEVTNTDDRRWSLDQLTVSAPLPEHLDELLAFEGRWTRELQETRIPWHHGSHLIENRRGRTSHEDVPLFFAGRTGFGEWDGEVVGAHVAWSGNHQLVAERLADGRRYVQGGELLHPGEVVLEPGDSYRTPDLVLTRSDAGLTRATWGFHRAVRRTPAHPITDRPVLINTWEAVYFDHDLAKLKALASTAADLGVERFVLDDGWFGGRRDDTKGLGEWWVSDAVYPDGLAPLIEHVTGLGMEFGIWVEPEMVNPDSDVYRAHPDWALITPGYDPVLGRQQLVLDLGNPEAFDFVYQHLDALFRDHDISYVKWDMNRDHIQGSGRTGSAGTSAQTRAVYRLLDALRSAHPRL